MREMAWEICTALVERRAHEEIRHSQATQQAYGFTLYPPSVKALSILNEGQDPRYESTVDAQEHIHSMCPMFLCAIGFAEQDAIHKNRFYLEKGWI
jgi:hypothetical protein